MFWKLIEFVVRIIYWRRFRAAQKIGEAAALLSNGKPEAALSHLEKHGNAVHQTLIPLFALTQGKIFEALKRFEEAEACFKTVVLANPKDARADIALAVLTGRQFRFDECRNWLNRAIEKESHETEQQAKALLAHLDAVEDGSKQAEYEARAQKIANKPLIDGKTAGESADRELLAKWIQSSDSPEVQDSMDDVALLLAFAEAKKGGHWKIGISIEDTVVVQPDGNEFSPFALIAQWLSSKDAAK